MVWIWHRSTAYSLWGASYDDLKSDAGHSGAYFSTYPLPSDAQIFYRTESPSGKLRTRHCLPTGTAPVVHDVWREIILRFVPVDRIQFLPIHVISGEMICDDYYWVIPFDRVECIDPDKSVLGSHVRRSDHLVIYDLEEMALHDNCMLGFHLARDKQMKSKLFVSDELRDALAATGEDDMFTRAEEFDPNSCL